ncbi:MAG: hypothetical protein WB443_08590, partial [Nitrososphaeraceae archaeon]
DIHRLVDNIFEEHFNSLSLLSTNSAVGNPAAEASIDTVKSAMAIGSTDLKGQSDKRSFKSYV